MANYRPALPGIPKYTRWEQVPDGLHTRADLGRMDPPRKPAKDASPVGQVLYHGNSYAPLFAIGDTVDKRRPSPAQLAALAEARRLAKVCRLCEGHDTDSYGDPVSLGKDRVCGLCQIVRTAYQQHLKAIGQLAPLLDQLRDGTAVILAVDDVNAVGGLAVRGKDFEHAIDLTVPWSLSPDAAFTQIALLLEEHLTGTPTVICWDSPQLIRSSLTLLLAPELPYPDPMTPDGWNREAMQARTHTFAVAEKRSQPFGWLHGNPPKARWTSIREHYIDWHAKHDPAYPPDRFRVDRSVNPLIGIEGALDTARELSNILHGAVLFPDLVSSQAPWLRRPVAIDDARTATPHTCRRLT